MEGPINGNISIVRHLRITSLLIALSTACTVAGPPAFPERITAPLAGPRCDDPHRPCRCVDDAESAGTPPEGVRRFEVRLPGTRGTASAVEIEGVGAVRREADDIAGSCFYLDLSPGATYRVRYLAQTDNRNRGITVAFSLRELGPEGWYNVIQQRCGTADTPCRYESVSDWIRAVESGHRFHDPCSSSRIEGARVDGGLYDRHFIDAQFSFNLILRHHPPTEAPGSACHESLAEPDSIGDDPPAQEE